MSITAARTRATTLLAGIRAGGCNLHRLPKRVFRTLSGRDGSGICKIRPLTVAGAAQVRLAGLSFTLLLPVELRRVNHVASTNIGILTSVGLMHALNAQIVGRYTGGWTSAILP